MLNGKWYWHLSPGFLVPVRDIRGRIEGFQIRRAEVKTDEPRYVWLIEQQKRWRVERRAGAFPQS